MLARCPSCRNTFSTDRSGRQDCPSCKKPLLVPEQPREASPAAPEPGAAPGTPWERREELGFWRGWAQTVQLALFEPGRLFAQARLDRGAAQLGFAVFTSSVFSAAGQLLERALLSGQREQLERLLGSVPPVLQKTIARSMQLNSWPAVLGLALLTPVISLIFVYLNAGFTHGVAVVLGQSKRGFPATFAACAYACAPLVLLAIPACGSAIAVVWLLVLTGIGMKETHRISPGGAAASVLVPYLVLCCLTMAGTMALVMAMRSGLGPR